MENPNNELVNCIKEGIERWLEKRERDGRAFGSAGVGAFDIAVDLERFLLREKRESFSQGAKWTVQFLAGDSTLVFGAALDCELQKLK